MINPITGRVSLMDMIEEYRDALKSNKYTMSPVAQAATAQPITYGNTLTHPGQPVGSDDVPLWGQAGEFVVNKEATDMFLPQIEAMNNQGRIAQGQPQALAMGGVVGDSTLGQQFGQWAGSNAGAAMGERLALIGAGDLTGAAGVKAANYNAEIQGDTGSVIWEDPETGDKYYTRTLGGTLQFIDGKGEVLKDQIIMRRLRKVPNLTGGVGTAEGPLEGAPAGVIYNADGTVSYVNKGFEEQDKKLNGYLSTALEGMPQAGRSFKILSDWIHKYKEAVKTGNYHNIPQTGTALGYVPDALQSDLQQNFLAEILGIANANLKATFGAQLSDGERKAYYATWPNLNMSEKGVYDILVLRGKEMYDNIIQVNSRQKYQTEFKTLIGWNPTWDGAAADTQPSNQQVAQPVESTVVTETVSSGDVEMSVEELVALYGGG